MLVFQFVKVVYHIDLSANTEEPLDTWDKAHLVMMCDLFNMLVNMFGRTCLRVFHLCSTVTLPMVVFSCDIIAWFWYWSDLGIAG